MRPLSLTATALLLVACNPTEGVATGNQIAAAESGADQPFQVQEVARF